MAIGGGSTPGGWAMGGARSAGGGSRVGSVGRGFSGTRGFARRPKSASGQPLQVSNIPYRGELDDLYSMVGRPIGGGLSPSSAGMIGDPSDIGYTPPGTGVGAGYQGYGSEYEGFLGLAPPSGAGDVLGQGYGGYEGPDYIGQKGVGAEPGFGGTIPPKSAVGVRAPIGITDPIYGPPGEDPMGGGYMGEDYASSYTPPYTFPPISKFSPYINLNKVIPRNEQASISPFFKQSKPERKQSYCLPGDPNCR